jgi:phosphatidylethanolamine-binding protein (PEBP) family uncharacterized protein
VGRRIHPLTKKLMALRSIAVFRPSSNDVALTLAASLLALGCSGDADNNPGTAASSTSTTDVPTAGPTSSAAPTTPVGPTGAVPPTAPVGPTGQTCATPPVTPSPSVPVTTGPTGSTSPAATPTEASGTVDTSSEAATDVGDSSSADVTSEPMGAEFTLLSPWTAKDTCTPQAKDTCDNIPPENRATFIGGNNVQPTITWTAGPPGTVAYAVVYQDLSNPADVNQPRSVHWAMWGIPADVLSISAGEVPPGAEQSAWVGNTWFGSGACNNVYELTVYALKAPIEPQGDKHTAVRDQLQADTGELVLAKDYARVTPKPPCQ